jgi:hypothetical protein
MLVASEISGKKKEDIAMRIAMLFHYTGPRVFEIYSTIGANAYNFDAVVTKLDDYFAAHTNVEFENFNFRLIKQEKTEKFDQFVTRLRIQASSCDFYDTEGEIKSQIICGCYSAELWRRCLREEMDFKNVILLGRSFEVSRNQAFEIEQAMAYDGNRDDVYYINKQDEQSTTVKPIEKMVKRSVYCGRDHVYGN